MKLNELLEICADDQRVAISVNGGYQYDGNVTNCPNHLLDCEVTKTETSHDKLLVYVNRSHDVGMTWRQIADAIESMPDWAQDMPATMYVESKERIHNDSNYDVSEIVTYFSKEPSEIQDDGDDFVFMVLGDYAF